MESIDQLKKNLSKLEQLIDYAFENKSLLIQACSHSSFVNEHPNNEISHSERLEFLGDSVLGMVISAELFEQFSEHREGILSSYRAKIVEAKSCCYFVQKLSIDSFLLLGKGERQNSGRGRESLLADFFEAIVGAIYLDGGFKQAQNFILSHFTEEIQTLVSQPCENWKAILQDYTQKHLRCQPKYEVIEQSGPDHDKQFMVAVFAEDKKLGVGLGSTKKQAQQMAAKRALDNLGENSG